MGESERYIDRRPKKITLGEDNNALISLIGINAIGLITVGILRLIYVLTDSTTATFTLHVLPWFVLPAQLSSLIRVPYTLLVYMFIHVSFINAFTNMLWLWAFGSILQDLAGNQKLIPIYLYGGIAGALVFIGANYAIPSLRPLLGYSSLTGAGPAIMAVAIATTSLTPDYKIFRMLNGGIPIWVLTVLYVIIDVAALGSGAPAYLLAHLAGGLAGFFFVVSLRNGKDPGAWMIRFYDWFLNLCNPDRNILTPQKTREKIFYKTAHTTPFEKHPIITQKRVDDILDKINQKGYNHLSDEEKNILKKASETDLS